VGTFDGTTVRFNVNGVPISSAAVAAYHPQTTKPLAIGQGEPGSGFFFPGVIDDAAVYGSALTASQVQTDYLLGTQGPTPTPTTTARLCPRWRPQRCCPPSRRSAWSSRARWVSVRCPVST
jgi:hypothetical protein